MEELSEKREEERKKMASMVRDKLEEYIAGKVTQIALIEALRGRVELLKYLEQVKVAALTVVNCLYYDGKIAIKTKEE